MSATALLKEGAKPTMARRPELPGPVREPSAHVAPAKRAKPPATRTARREVGLRTYKHPALRRQLQLFRSHFLRGEDPGDGSRRRLRNDLNQSGVLPAGG